jgi:hypothetical protein
VFEIIWQLKRHQVVLEHQKVQSKVLNPVVYVPGVADPILNEVLLLNQ